MTKRERRVNEAGLNEKITVRTWYPSCVSYVRQTDACCHPRGTLCAPAGLVKLGDSGGSDSGNCGGGREVQSGEGGHTQNLKKRIKDKKDKTGFEAGNTGERSQWRNHKR